MKNICKCGKEVPKECSPHMVWRISIHLPVLDGVNWTHEYLDPFSARPCEAEAKRLNVENRGHDGLATPFDQYKLDRTYVVWSKDGKKD